MGNQILIGKGELPCYLEGRYANRHGLVAGATGTGKTVTLQVLSEGFSDLGVPVFMADIKGDLAGISQKGADNPKFAERASKLGVSDYRNQAYPTVFWDVFGEQGHPVRATISDMGPLLLARLMDLNDTQEGVLTLLFKYADDNGLLLLDLKDLRSLVSFAVDNTAAFGKDYGTVGKQTLGIIQRELLTLEQQGADKFFGEPALKLEDFMQTTLEGRGHINVLAADKLFQQPKLYSTFLLWLLSELYENLPERGDADLPKLVFFFDEAHLLFADAPKALLDKIEQVVRLIRSKGVGVYFVTQNPLDIPDSVLGQLGNRVQHALRAFTPRDQKAVKAAAETFRAKPGLDVATVITELGVGEALISTLGEGGIPSPVERAKVCPPRSRLGAVTAEERAATLQRSPFRGRYEETIDRESAYERLSVRTQEQAATAAADAQAKADAKAAKAPARQADSVWEAAAKSAVRAASSEVGRSIGKQLLRGLLGSLQKSMR
ncbi:MAG TPA: helicase HerA-like domain-containing protein [Moraxellaceae bacterium]